MNGNHYSGLLKSKSPASYSSQCLVTQPSAALITPAGPYECHIKPSAALSAASQDECHTGQIGSLFCFSPDKVSYHISCSQVDPQTRSSSAVLTVPTLQIHVSSSVSAQSRHQTKPYAVPPRPCSVWQSCSASFPIWSQLPYQAICSPHTMAGFLQGWPVPVHVGSSMP